MSEQIEINGLPQDQAVEFQGTKPANHHFHTSETDTARKQPTKEEQHEAISDFWVNEVLAALGGVVGSTVHVGKVLAAAKQNLGRGNLESLLTHPKCPLDDRTCQMLTRLASHPILADAVNHCYLPRSFVGLYLLAAVDPARLEQGLDAGDIHPGMTLKQVKEIVQSYKDR